jgi:hypothetical protein
MLSLGIDPRSARGKRIVRPSQERREEGFIGASRNETDE